jgi:hypothetical protein
MSRLRTVSALESTTLCAIFFKGSSDFLPAKPCAKLPPPHGESRLMDA